MSVTTSYQRRNLLQTATTDQLNVIYEIAFIDEIYEIVKVTEWPPIGKIAAHSAYDMFHGIST